MRPIPPMVAVMTPFPYHIDAGASLAEARALMEEHDIRHLPVFARGDVAGVISARDLGRASLPGHPLHTETELRVGDLCRHRPYFVDVADPLDRVLDAMAESGLGSALVLKEGTLAGIFTAADACRLYANTLRTLHPRPGPGTDAA